MLRKSTIHLPYWSFSYIVQLRSIKVSLDGYNDRDCIHAKNPLTVLFYNEIL